MSIKILCLNTAIDHNVDVSSFSVGGIMRSETSRQFASGKGVNSAFAISALGLECRLYCVCGVHDVGLFEEMGGLIASRVETVDAGTRVNLTVTEAGTTLVCHIQTPGPVVPAQVFSRVVDQLLDDLCAEDVVIVSGSLPKGIISKDVGNWIAAIAKKNCRIILDVDPMYWKDIDLNLLHWMKPNLEEWGRYLGKELKDEADVLQSFKGSVGAANVIVSLGDRGALALNPSKGSHLRVWTDLDEAAVGNVIGCGDSMVAGLAAGLLQNNEPGEALRYAVSAGYANLFGDGPGRISKTKFDYAFQRFCIERSEGQNVEGGLS